MPELTGPIAGRFTEPITRPINRPRNPRGRGGGGGAVTAWDPANKDADITLSGGNLVASITAPAVGSVIGTQGADAALNKYFEITIDGPTVRAYIGAGRVNAAVGVAPGGVSANYSVGLLMEDKDIYVNGVVTDANYLSPATFDPIGLIYDADTGTIQFVRQGTLFGTAFSVTPNSTLFLGWGPGTAGAGTRTCTVNTGASAFFYGKPNNCDAWGGTWNSADKAATVTLSGGDLVASVTTALGGVRGTVSWNTGRHYAEFTMSGADASQVCGVSRSTATLASYPGFDANGYGYELSTGQKITNAVLSAIAAPTSVVLGCQVNAGAVKFSLNGRMGADAGTTGITGLLYPMFGADTAAAGARTGTINAAGPFFYPLPSGASAWG